MDLALAVDGKTIILYVRTLRSPYQYLCMQPLSKLQRVFDQRASQGLCSLQFVNEVIIMIKDADADLLAIFLKRLKQSF